MSPAARTDPRESSATATRLRILIADDDRDSVLTLLLLLREEGHEARGVYNGAAVLALMNEFDPDVVLLDIAMPGLSGWDVARKIRETYGEKLTLVGVSGVYTQAADHILGKMAGFNHYLFKPYAPSVLLKLLREV